MIRFLITSLEVIHWKLWVTTHEAPAAVDTTVTVQVHEVDPTDGSLSAALAGKVNGSQPDHGSN